MTWTNPSTQSAGTIITAAIWNQQLIENLFHIASGRAGLAGGSGGAGGPIYTIGVGGHSPRWPAPWTLGGLGRGSGFGLGHRRDRPRQNGALVYEPDCPLHSGRLHASKPPAAHGAGDGRRRP